MAIEHASGRAAIWAAIVVLGGCGTVPMLTRPEGDGGWTQAERERQLVRLAQASGVDLDPAPPTTTRTEAAPAPAMPTSPTPAREAMTTDHPPMLSLADALTRAATGNRRLAEARAQRAIARQRVYEARGRLFPATSGRGRYTWNTDEQRNAVPIPGIVVGQQPSIPIRDREIGTISGVVNLPVDLSGELRYTLAAAQAGYRGEAARLWAATLETDVVVIGAYYNLLEAERLRDVTIQTIALHRQQLTFADDRFRNGRLTKNEVLVVQLALRNAEQEQRRRALAIDEARFALNQAVGLPIDTPTKIVDVRERPELPGETEALRAAYRGNPVLLALLEEQQRLDASASALARSRFPRFSGGGSVEDSNSKILAPTLIGAGFLGFEWDLGTDTRREADIAAARIAADENRLRTERELRELEQAVRSTYRSAVERLAALDTSEIAVQQAEENLRIRQQQFEVGRATSDDVLDAEALLAGERASVASARYEAQTRRAELQRLMGQPLDALAAGR